MSLWNRIKAWLIRLDGKLVRRLRVPIDFPIPMPSAEELIADNPMIDPSAIIASHVPSIASDEYAFVNNAPTEHYGLEGLMFIANDSHIIVGQPENNIKVFADKLEITNNGSICSFTAEELFHLHSLVKLSMSKDRLAMIQELDAMEAQRRQVMEDDLDEAV